MAADDELTATDGQPADGKQPVLEVSGNPTDEELAALVTVLVSASAPAAAPPAPSVPSRWRDPLRAVRQPWHPRPGAWPAGSWGVR